MRYTVPAANRLSAGLLLLLSFVCLSACDPPVLNPQGSNGERGFELSVSWPQHETLAEAARKRVLADVLNLQTAVRTLLDQPSEQGLLAARFRWQQLHISFSVMEYYYHKMPDPETVTLITNRIDSWPVAPGYLDSLPDYPYSGIINDITLPLDASSLISQHRLTAAEEVSLGLHALEYLLWQRDVSDFEWQSELSVEQQADNMFVHQLSQNRRRLVVKLLVDILVEDLHQLDRFLHNSEQQPGYLPNPMLAIDWGINRLTTLITRTDGQQQHSPHANIDPSLARVLISLLWDTYYQQSDMLQVLQNEHPRMEEDFSSALLLLIEYPPVDSATDQVGQVNRVNNVKLLKTLYQELLLRTESG